MNNKNFYCIVLVLCTIFISSCKVKKALVNNDNTVIIDDNTNRHKDTIQNNDHIVYEINDTISIDTLVSNLKEVYEIALILPLFADSIKRNYSYSEKEDLSDFDFPVKSLQALNFLEGALQAIENLNLKSKISLKIFDNKYSYKQTMGIIEELSNENIDLIVGPMKKQNIQLVSNFAKSNNILMLSPFSPSKTAGNNYSKYIMVQPSIDMHFKTIADYIVDSLNNHSVKIIYPNSSFGTKNAYQLQAYIQALNDSLNIQNRIAYSMLEVASNTNDRRDFDIENYLDLEIENLVIIVSFNEGFVHSMLTSLNTQLKNYKIKVFGMPNWKDSKSLRIDYFEKLNLHYSDSKWIEEKDPNTELFVEIFKKDNHYPPTEDAYLGYDIFRFFPVLLDKYGLNLDQNIDKETYNGLLNKYHFVSLENQNSNISKSMLKPRIENNRIHIIEYKNYQLNKKR